MASSVLISGFGNGGFGQTSFGLDLLQVSVDGNDSASAVGDVRVALAPTLTGQGIVSATGGEVVSLGILATGQAVSSAAGDVTPYLEIEVFVTPQGLQIQSVVTSVVVWRPIDDGQNAVWADIAAGATAWTPVVTGSTIWEDIET